MCGITGVYNYKSAVPPSRHIGEMLSSIMHRGTVDGTWSNETAALGSRRLPIVDLENSPQPIFSENKNLILIGNGEIYNFNELRSNLLKKGHRFSTSGDLECILHLYQEQGNEVWNKLRGMFAVAIYDRNGKTLTLARDHMGIKPLFYYDSVDSFLFASEMRSITIHPSFKKELNTQSVADFLSLQFIPKPQTIYKGLLSLPPASFLVMKEGNISIKKYWTIEPDPSNLGLSREDIAAKTLSLLKTSVKRRLMADVPVGVLLSGGLDSSMIAALTNEMASEQVETFSIVFKEASFDESPFSRLMARHLGTNHHEVVLNSSTILGSIENISYHLEEPFCEGSAFPIYHICNSAKDYVTVILSGEGADEIFCGYEPYAALNLSRYYKKIPYSFHQLFSSMVNRLPVSEKKVSLDLKLKRFTSGVGFDPPKAHFWFRCSMNDDEKYQVLTKDFLGQLIRPAASVLYEDQYNTMTSEDTLNKIMATDCNLHLADDLLLRADRMSMAHTMELRVPFLDIDLVNFAFSLPSSKKLSFRQNKIPLRDAVKGLIPNKIRLRPKKGLNMPYQQWFRQKGWKEILHDCLLPENLKSMGFFNVEAVQKMLSDHTAKRKNNAHALWTMMNLILWLKNNPI
ncbi:MAG: asparagine synthase (glutamine-hydrolyzing) [Deltaproteobacteria bacterium]|nr:asparagine synthase (glutamine-hydrolyzing) [Deltaproteobacteria bacterium]